MTDDELRSIVKFVRERNSAIRSAIVTTVTAEDRKLHRVDLERAVRERLAQQGHQEWWDYDRFLGELSGLSFRHEIEPVDIDYYQAPFEGQEQQELADA